MPKRCRSRLPGTASTGHVYTGLSGTAEHHYAPTIAKVVQKLGDPPVRSERPDRKVGAFAFLDHVLPSGSTCRTSGSLSIWRCETRDVRDLARGLPPEPRKSQSLGVSSGTPLEPWRHLSRVINTRRGHHGPYRFRTQSLSPLMPTQWPSSLRRRSTCGGGAATRFETDRKLVCPVRTARLRAA